MMRRQIKQTRTNITDAQIRKLGPAPYGAENQDEIEIEVTGEEVIKQQEVVRQVIREKDAGEDNGGQKK